MIKDWVKDCIVSSGLSVEDVIFYCDVTKDDVENILNGDDYDIKVADNIISRLGMFTGKTKLPDTCGGILHVELEHGMILFRKDSDTKCRFLTLSGKIETKVERLSPNCYEIEMNP